MIIDPIGDRFKGYENSFKFTLPKRLPMILRIDGKAFHSYTKGCQRPFDEKLLTAMDNVALTLCKEIQGAQIAYVQSDEISIFIHNYKKLNSGAWFDAEVQKIVSVAASIAGTTMTMNSFNVFGKYKPAYFDARVFIVPEADVCNAFIWRQKDCIRNSVQMLARTHFSHKECNNKNQPALKDLCQTKGIIWDELPSYQKNGRCALKVDGPWQMDRNIPVFQQDRNYIERFLVKDEE
jgi:tRNA(His) guanylyltransferase